eukprot:COSAG04_NODE_7098_length_1192_cov_1.138152_2_plen_21_part_01
MQVTMPLLCAEPSRNRSRQSR